jgi:hypothetical protein
MELERAEAMGVVESPTQSLEPATRSVGGRLDTRYMRLDESNPPCLVTATSPSVRLFVLRGLTVTPRTRRSYPRQSVFLDGVYGGAPFLDHDARQYSLDHHAGCIRAFTIATCEQAAAMLLMGLPLEEGEWRVHINEPDLDAVLAAWILMNHLELRRDRGGLLERIMPLVRVEGVIDTHGLERGVLTGLPREVLEAEQCKVDALLEEERELKATGEWKATDPLAYTGRLLHRLDELFIPREHLTELLSAETIEMARAPIQQRKLAVLCRSQRGIYEVESELKERHDKRVGVVVLDQGGGHFTLRQCDPFLTRNLEHLYRLLNREDAHSRDGNRWGGSAEIGGSPRETGSGLDGSSILALVAEEYAGGGTLARLWRRIRALRWARRCRGAARALWGRRSRAGRPR